MTLYFLSEASVIFIVLYYYSIQLSIEVHNDMKYESNDRVAALPDRVDLPYRFTSTWFLLQASNKAVMTFRILVRVL